MQKAYKAVPSDFWSQFTKSFSEYQLTRDEVKKLIEKTRRNGARNMPDIAIALKASDSHSQNDELRRFCKLKNFLYKTVKI